MKKILYSVIFALILTAGLPAMAATTITVGPAEDGYDYQTISAAIKAAGTTETEIEIADGTYKKNLKINAKQNITLSSASSNETDVIIQGKILVKKNSTASFDHVTINAKKKKYAIKTSGILDITDSIIRQGKDNIIAQKTAALNIYGTKILKARRHGVVIKNKADAHIEGSTIKNSKKAGLRAYKNKTSFTLRQSTISYNKTGVIIKNSSVENDLIYDTFKENTTAVIIDNSPELYTYDNEYISNDTNIVTK